MQGQAVTLGHEFEATIYKKRDKSYISEEGRELEIINYQLSKRSLPTQVVRRGVYHCPVGTKPTTGIYTGASPLWRISHNVSRFATQIERLKTLLPSPEHQLELNIMLEEVSDGFHDDSSEISRLNSKLIGVIQSARSSGTIIVGREGADDELIVEKKKTKDFEKLWNYQNQTKKDLPTLHYACMEGMSPFIIDMLVGQFGNEALESIIEIRGEVLEKIGLSPPARENSSQRGEFWRVAPIHLAILCGHIELVQHFAEHYPQCIAVEMPGAFYLRNSNYDVLALSAFSSLANFQSICTLKADSIVNVPETVEMALLGGNLELIQRLPTLCSLSFEDLFHKNNGLLWRYWHLAAVRGHLSLVEWIFKNFNHISTFKAQTSLNVGNDDINSATIDLIDKFQSLAYRQSFWEWAGRKEVDLCKLVISQLPILQWLIKSSSTTMEKCYHDISKSQAPLWAACNGYTDVFLWLSKSPHFDPHLVYGLDFNSTAHMACVSDSDGILQILFDWALEKRRGNSKPNLSFFHLLTQKNSHIAHIAASNGSLKCLQWMTTHLEEFQGRKGLDYFLALKDKNGASVLHFAAQNGNEDVLSWIDKTFNPNWTSPDDSGYEPIHKACRSLSGLKWVYGFAGINLDVLTKDGLSTAWLAASDRNFEVLDFIVSKIGPSCLMGIDGKRFAPVEHLVGYEPIKMLEWLVKVGYNFSLADQFGNTFAHRIAYIIRNDEHLIALEWLKTHTNLKFNEQNNVKKTAVDLLTEVKSLQLSRFASCLQKLSAK